MVKKCFEYEKLRLFYGIPNDADLKNSIFSVKLVVLFALVGTLFLLVSGNRNYLEIFVYYTIQLACIICGFAAKKNVKRYRKYYMLYLVLVFAALEYTIVAQSVYSMSGNMLTHVIVLVCITVFLWGIKLIFTLHYIVRVHKVADKEVKKMLEKYSRQMNTVAMFVLTLSGIIIVPIRHMEANTGFALFKSPQFVFAVHMIFSLFYAMMMDRILFSFVFREEIRCELERKMGDGSMSES